MSSHVPQCGNRNTTLGDVGSQLSRNLTIPVDHDKKEARYKNMDDIQPGCSQAILDTEDQTYSYADIPGGGSLTLVELQSQISSSDDGSYDDVDNTYSETYAEIPGGDFLTPEQLHPQINSPDGRNYDDDEDVYMVI